MDKKLFEELTDSIKEAGKLNKDANKTINLQGTAKMKVNVSQYARDMQNKHQEIKIVNTMDSNQVREYLGTKEGAQRITDIINDARHNARRIQPLPEHLQNVRMDNCTANSNTCTLNPENLPRNYRGTRTSRAIAAIRHTANNAWTVVKRFIVSE